MARFGYRTTADQELDGLDLSGRTYLVTGCASGLGLEAVRALAARGARVIGTARSAARAGQAEAVAPGRFIPIACDQDEFGSVLAAAAAIRALSMPLDAIVANAGIMAPPDANVRYGVESQFRVNHLSHMLLVCRLADLLRDGTGRLVMVSSSAVHFARRGIDLDDLDGVRGYAPMRFYGQSKLANLAFAKSMAERLAPRGIVSNAIHPGVIASTGLPRTLPRWMRVGMRLGSPLGKTIAQGAATQVWAAAHPDAGKVTGGFFASCRPFRGNAYADDPAFRAALWERSAQVLATHDAAL